MNVLELIKQSDENYNCLKIDDDYVNLKSVDKSQSPELQWRFCRAVRYKILNDPKCNDKNKKELISDGLNAAKNGIAFDDNNSKCHNWLGIFLDLESKSEGINKRIENAFKIRDEFEKCLKLDPNNFVALHSMGNWCFAVASIGYFHRVFAKTLFSEPPNSSFEEALKYFLEAEKIAPLTLIDNLCKIAECYQHLNNIEKAQKYAKTVLEMDINNEEAREIKKIARKIVK